MLLNCGVGEYSWESLGLQGDQTSQSYRKSTLNIHLMDWCWSWNSQTLATWREELTHLKRPWCWERLRAGEGDVRRWDGWMASLTQWTWVWVDSGSWWWRGRPGVLHFMESQRIGYDWVTELNWLCFWWYSGKLIFFHSIYNLKLYRLLILDSLKFSLYVDILSAYNDNICLASRSYFYSFSYFITLLFEIQH